MWDNLWPVKIVQVFVLPTVHVEHMWGKVSKTKNELKMPARKVVDA